MSDAEEVDSKKSAPFSVDRAKQGRANCKGRKQKCSQWGLRIAKVVPSPYGDGNTMKSWHHVDCFMNASLKQRPATKRVDSLQDIGGFEELDDDDRKRSRSETAYSIGMTPQTPQRNVVPFPRLTATPSMQHVRTPSAERKRTWQPSVDRALAGITVKDHRPLANNAWQRKQLNRLQSYLAECMQDGESGGFAQPLIPKPLTIARFVDLVSQLLAPLNKTPINVSNYVTKLPVIAKKLLYPGDVTKSWLMTVNTDHTFPQVIGLLSYLMDLKILMRSHSETAYSIGMTPQTPQRNVVPFPRLTATPSMQHVRTPSAERKWTWQISVDRALVGIIVKDHRPLADKAWRRKQLNRLQTYLAKCCQDGELNHFAQVMIPKPLSIAQFLVLVRQLLAPLNKTPINVSNYVTKLPVILKKLLYPGAVTKSWLMTVNTIDTFPQVIELLSYLMDLNILMMEGRLSGIPRRIGGRSSSAGGSDGGSSVPAYGTNLGSNRLPRPLSKLSIADPKKSLSNSARNVDREDFLNFLCQDDDEAANLRRRYIRQTWQIFQESNGFEMVNNEYKNELMALFKLSEDTKEALEQEINTIRAHLESPSILEERAEEEQRMACLFRVELEKKCSDHRRHNRDLEHYYTEQRAQSQQLDEELVHFKDLVEPKTEKTEAEQCSAMRRENAYADEIGKIDKELERLRQLRSERDKKLSDMRKRQAQECQSNARAMLDEAARTNI